MRRFLTAIVALAATGTLAAPAPVPALVGGRHVEVLQYAHTPGAGPKTKLRLAHRLQRLGLEVRAFEKLPMLVVFGTSAQVRAASRQPGVLYHHAGDRPLRFALDRSVPLVFGSSPPAPWAAGFDGRGITAAVVDTGADGTHPDLISRIKANVEFAFDGAGFDNDAQNGPLPGVAVTTPCPGPCDSDAFGHGTHVAGTIAGDGSVPVDAVKGMAPGAQLVVLSISQSGTSLEFYALAGFEYLLAHPELDVKVVNNSWSVQSGEFDPTNPVNQASKMLHDKGVTMVFAAANSGPGRAPATGQPDGASDCTDGGDCRISLESVAPWAISVAAGARVTLGPPSSQHLADFSSRGDPKPHKVKGGLTIEYMPTLTAPGTGIISATGGSAAINTLTCGALGDLPRCLDRTVAQNLFYTAISGTSMATPHVVGAVAVLQGAAKAKMGRYLSPDEVKALLVAGAQPMPGIDGQYDNCGTDVPTYAGPCGGKIAGTTGKPYARWQVGAGYLDMAGSLRALDALAHPAPVVKPKKKKKLLPLCKAKKKTKAKPKAKRSVKKRSTKARCRSPKPRTKKKKR